MTNFEKVGLFMKTFGQEVKNNSGLSSEKINSLRISLISEELDELKKAISDNDIVEVDDKTEKQHLDYAKFVPALVKSVQELSEKVEEQQKEIEKLKNQ